jgi:hypothetical protein
MSSTYGVSLREAMLLEGALCAREVSGWDVGEEFTDRLDSQLPSVLVDESSRRDI